MTTPETQIEWEMPEPVPPDEDDPRIQAALAELRDRIRQHYPDATFDTYLGAEGDMIWLRVTGDVEDPYDVRNVVGDRILDMQSEEGLPVSVIVLRIDDRVKEHDR